MAGQLVDGLERACRGGAAGLLVMCVAAAGCRRAGPTVIADPEPGIALTLAAHRARALENIRYQLSFDIPAAAEEPIASRLTVRFVAKDVTQPLVLDFAAGASHLTSVSIAGRPSTFRVVNGHIVIPAR